MSSDCSPNSETMHKDQIENHLKKMHRDYKVNSEEEIKMMPSLKSQAIPKKVHSEAKIIQEINKSFDNHHLEEIDEQRQDVFDPYGCTKWCSKKLGGFDFGQNRVPFTEATKKELQEKKEKDRGVALISNSFAMCDAMANMS